MLQLLFFGTSKYNSLLASGSFSGENVKTLVWSTLVGKSFKRMKQLKLTANVHINTQNNVFVVLQTDSIKFYFFLLIYCFLYFSEFPVDVLGYFQF